MKDIRCKIVRAICDAQKLGIVASFEMDLNGDVIVFLEGKHLDSCDHSLEAIYARIMDAVTEKQFEKEWDK